MIRSSLLFGFLLLFSSLQSQPNSWSSRGVGGGGALFSPSINPANNDEYFVACDLSALFHTTDYGKQYDLVHFTELQAGHNSKVCYTATPGLRYCVHYANDRVVPVKSTDAGLTWNTLPGNPDEFEETFSIWADYNHPNRLLIAYYGLIYFSNNGGTTFSLVHTALSNGSGCLIGGAFFDGDNIYLGTNDGVIISTNGGNSWATAAISGLPANERIFSFAAAKSGNTTRFFCLTGDVGNLYVGQPGSDYWNFMRGVYFCDYGVTNWATRMGGITVGTDFPMFVDMAENDINTVYLAGSNSSSVPIILKTSNAGVQWTNTFLSTNNQNINTGWSGQGGDRGWSYGECPFGFDVAANDANRVIFGDFGFVHKTSNGGQTWQQAYVNTSDQHPVNQLTPPKQPYHSVGLENTTSWQVLWANATTLFAGFSDIKGIRSTDGGQTWSFNYSGLNANSTYRLAQHSNGTLFAATSNIHDMYQSTRLADSPLDNADAEGKLLYSTDNGATWQLLHLFGHPVFWIALDPNNPNRAYASVIHYNAGNGVGGVYRCDNLLALGGSTWTLLPNPPRTQKHPASITVLNDGKVVASYSGRRNASGVFTNSSGVFIYDPVTNTWQDVSAAGMQYWTKDIVPAPDDAAQNTWYAAVFSGWGGAPNGLGGLYRTINRGQSWTKLTGSQFDRATSITFNPLNAKQVYLTTEQTGLWITNDISVTNPTFTLVESYPYRQPERVFFNPFKPCEIWISSFGNGIKTGDLVSATITPNDATTFCQGNSVQLSANAGASYLWNNGATTQDINVSTSGNYVVTVTYPGGCSAASSGTVVTVNPLPIATITAGGATTFCQGSSVQLNTSAGSSYLWNNGATTASISVSTSGNYVVTVTNAKGCSAASPGTVVTVNPLPIATITAGGATTFCQGSSVQLNASAGSSYLWNNGATTQNINVSTSGNYVVSVTNANGCSAASPGTVVTVNPLPIATITAGGSTTFCQGNSVQLSASAGSSYLWNNGATTASISVSTSGNYVVTVTNASGCSAASSGTSVTVNPLPIATITAGGTTTFCEGNSVQLSASAGSSYLWNNGATSASISVSTSGNYVVTVTNANGCSAASSGTVVTVNPLPIATITAGGATTFCEGNSVQLSASAGSSYLWNNGVTTLSINVSTSGNYVVTVTNANGCSAASSGTVVTVNPLPIATITAGGATTFCEGSSVQLSASAGSSYLWNTGATTQNISVSTSGNYVVTVTNANGCSAASSGTVVTVNPLPIATITTGGATTFCEGSSVQLSASAGSSYLWNNGATTPSINVSISGNYVVTVTNANGCSAASSGTVVTVNPLPIATITAGGVPTFCEGNSVQLSASAGSSYLWSTGATTGSISVSTSGDYVVTVTNANGCSAVSTQISVTVYPLPPVPTIMVNGTILTSSSGAGNQWYLNGNIIAGATDQTLMVTQNGSYSVVVTNNNGCFSASDIYNIINTETHQIIENNIATITPNPNNGKFKIEIRAGNSSLEIFNLLGREIYSFNIQQEISEVDISDQPNGIYFVRISSVWGKQTIKILKIY